MFRGVLSLFYMGRTPGIGTVVSLSGVIWYIRPSRRPPATTQFHIPQPNKYAHSDSSPFISDESLSDEDSSQTFMTPSTTLTPSTTSNQNSPQANTKPFITSNNKPLTPLTNDNSLYKNIIDTPHTNIPTDRSRHLSQNQTDSLSPLIDRTTKTTYKLRHQPKLDYRLFIPPSQLYS